MLSDEERKEYIEHEILDRLYCLEENDFDKNKVDDGYIKAVLNACKEAKNLIEKQQKEIEELKEERKSYAEEYIHNNPWLYKQLNENYILRVESEQKERKAWIKGTNDADELCNKKWEDKIKAKIDEVCESTIEESNVDILYSLLEKE